MQIWQICKVDIFFGTYFLFVVHHISKYGKYGIKESKFIERLLLWQYVHLQCTLLEYWTRFYLRKVYVSLFFLLIFILHYENSKFLPVVLDFCPFYSVSPKIALCLQLIEWLLYAFGSNRTRGRQADFYNVSKKWAEKTILVILNFYHINYT